MLAFILRVYRLDHQSLWYDEAYTAFVAGIPSGHTDFTQSAVPEAWRNGLLWWVTRDFMPPLYWAVQAAWLPFVGWSEFSLRFVSLWAGTLLVAVIVRLGRDIGRAHLAGVLSGFLASVSPFLVWYSQEARAYVLQALFTALAMHYLLIVLRSPGRRRAWYGLAVTCTLLLYTHTTSVLLVGCYIGVCIASMVVSQKPAWKLRALRAWLKWPGASRALLALGCAVIAWLLWLLPALISGYPSASANYWRGVLDWRYTFSQTFVGMITGGLMHSGQQQTAVVAWAFAVSLGMLAMVLSRRPRYREALLVVAQFAIPVGGMAWILDATPIAKYHVRYLTVAHPPLFLLSAAALSALFTRSLSMSRRRYILQVVSGVVLLAILLVVAGTGLHNLYFDTAFHKTDFRAIARHVLDHQQVGDVVMLLPGPHFPLWQYYGANDGWVAVPELPTIDVNAILYYYQAANIVNEALARRGERSGVWLITWERDQSINDPSKVMHYLLCQVGHEALPMTRIGDVTAIRCELDDSQLPLNPVPDLTHRLQLQLDQIPLTSSGCVLSGRVPADRAIPISCFWTADGKLPRKVAVSARLCDRAGNEWARYDSPISGLTANRWRPGELVLGQYIVQPPPGLPPGSFYEIHLIVHGDWGRHDLRISELTIDRPSAPPAWEAFAFTQMPYQPRRLNGSGLIVESVSVRPLSVLPGADVEVEAIWFVEHSPVVEPVLFVGREATPTHLLPNRDAIHAWTAGDRYRTITRVPVSPYALGGELLVHALVGDAGGTVLGSVQCDIERVFRLPAGVPQLNYRLGPSIRLIGAHVVTSTGQASPIVDVTLYWQGEGDIQHSYTAFVHLVGPDGRVIAQCDSIPQAGRHPTNHWLALEVVPDHCQLTLPPESALGPFSIYAGMYSWPSLARLPVIDGYRNLVSDDAILVGRFEL